MTAQGVRETFLRFFADRGHKIVRSSPLLPKDDPTILFTNAGMNQFKSVFLGLEKRGYSRAATVQKCMRVSGKHNDLETVGRTAKHHTFFEMLGNFSFGDYFKREAIAYAWELITRVFGLPLDRLYATVYLDDDEAYRLWAEEIGVPKERIFRFGKKDNFWAMGDSGPCGPCSELHYDLGAEIEPGDPFRLIESGSDRFVELWNLVFMEFDQGDDGVLRRLPSPSIDTGMGLERITAVIQGKRSNFDTDLFMPLIESACAMARREYPAGDEGDVAVRIIADHIRAVTFLIGDGVSPANDGRGYVLRRLIRRACRQGSLIGLDKPFLFELVGRVADVMKEAYPELLASAEYIAKVCLAEEERFAFTLSSGLRFFDQAVQETRAAGGSVLPGNEVFKLYDTFGFPLDLSQELAREKAMTVDEAGFLRELEEQKNRARLSWKGEAKRREKQVYEEFKGLKVRYRVHEAGEMADVQVLGLLKDGRRADVLGPGDSGEVILAETPFYAEAGGQVGDTGSLAGPGFSAVVENVSFAAPEIIVHAVKVLTGELRQGDRVDAAPDLVRRQSVSNNHTATHLLHAALRQVLGDHVKQAGSLVSAERLRFDFTHFAALSPEEIRRVEEIVNAAIRADIPVATRVTSLDEGIREGAMAIFEEKYGESVRVVGIGDVSKELCGGVHVRATGQIGLFKIVSETSAAAGLRRVEAVTGEGAIRYVRELEDALEGLEKGLGVGRRDLPARIEKLRARVEELEKETRDLRREKLSGAQAAATVIKEVKGIKIEVRRLDGLTMAELREKADDLKSKLKSGLIVIGSATEGKAFLVVSVTKDLAGRVQAGALIKELAPVIGGGGGGRPDFAQSGGPGAGELDKALSLVPDLVERLAG
ncbi:MAG TPA: alanine--tRNA ligase [Candidatus Aminicenantes bacterium]|nr:alanine--tRNA ligase [Candidatus Aminicenantes bacterium]HRY65146.1 alanine--tRNA ligase [Candidatus Aminicenantes bacterium]HRZ72386.1 alanine--tRNA ligase [Candidatus Aminicenantes bacterium]